MMRFGLIGVMVVSGAAGSAWAHDFFLVPSPARLSAPGQTLVRMHVTEGFPGQASPWRTDKTMSLCAIGPGGQPVQPLAWPAEGADGATIALKQPGTYLVALTLSPSTITLEGSIFTEYLTHEGHRDLIRARAERGATEAEAR